MAAVNVRVASPREFDAAIERIGGIQDSIAKLKKESDALVQLVSGYAVENNIAEGVAGDYEYALVGAPRALKKSPEMKTEDVIALLEAKPETSVYVFRGIDTDALKKAFGRNAATRKEVEKYGYFFTDPTPNKIKVSHRE